jgi:uroporphyrinogen III methyltransferase/synthase
MAGKIVLIGAGPGDPGLLTLKGQRWLRRADVVVYDYLANPRLLEHAPAQAQCILVGKHGGGARVDQDTITALLLEHARAGRTVVRLKGGDPFLFGRGAEEAAAAQAAGIEVEIVPGVTSALAVPAYAGIPLTHRDWASNVVVTTGYEYPGKPELAVHWEELGRPGSTLVILMTQRQLRPNMERLIAAGRSPDTPAAMIEWGTRAAQRTIVGTIADLADRAEQAAVRPPAMAVVGEVVRLRNELRWIERKPLFGRRIVVTRPVRQAGELAERLEDLGAEIVLLPAIEIAAPESYEPLDAALRRPADFDWLLFTSVNGVAAFFERLLALDLDIRAWHGCRVAAIGTQTAAALHQHAVRVDLVPSDFRAEGLLEALLALGVEGKRFLLPRAAGARDILPVELRARGGVVTEVTAYRSVPARQDEHSRDALFASGGVDLLTFTSSSTVHHFAALCGDRLGEILARAQVACIGPITAATARSYGMTIAVEPKVYTIPAFVEAIRAHYAN